MERNKKIHFFRQKGVTRGFTPFRDGLVKRFYAGTILWQKISDRKNRKSLTGFTLIELLVVIAIIGVLASIVMASLNTSRQKGRNSKRKADLRQIATALELYYNDNNGYPSTGGGWRGACSSYGSYPDSGAGAWIPNMQNYMASLPRDPSTASTYLCGSAAQSCYLYLSDGTNYKLLAHCTPESSWNSSDQFYDPVRPTWAWQVSTPAVRSTW